MKIIALIAGICMVFTVALAPTSAAEVSSANVVGVINMDVPGDGTFSLVGVNFEGIQKQGTLDDVFGTRGFNAAPEWGAPSTADQLFVWNGAGYDIFALHWSGVWLGVNDGAWWTAEPAPKNIPITRGDAVWVRKVGGSAPAPLQVIGQAVKTVNPFEIRAGLFDLLSYPFTADIELDDMGFVESGAAAAPEWGAPSTADQLFVWNGAGYDIFALHWSGIWLGVNDGAWWTAEPAPSGAMISMGGAFWYKSINGFEWDPQAPVGYSL